MSNGVCTSQKLDNDPERSSKNEPAPSESFGLKVQPTDPIDYVEEKEKWI